MILVEITINSTLHRVSAEGVALAHWWDNAIVGFDAPQLAVATNHGGFVRPAFGGISFSPDLFASDWPPPVSCPIAVYYADPDAADPEAGKETIMDGTAHRSEITSKAVRYDLYGPTYDETISDGTAYNDTLNAVLTTILTGIAEISSVVTTLARASSPNVDFTVSGDQVAIDLASEIAAFYSHLFYVEGATAYLVDMLLDNGSRTIDEFAFKAPTYSDQMPVATAHCTSGGNTYTRTSSYPYGRALVVQPYHGTQANIEAALDDIISVENKARVALPVPFTGSRPAPGEKISWADTALSQDTEAYIRARIFRFDFMNELLTIEGEGEISAP